MPSDRSRLRVLEATLAVSLLVLIAMSIGLIPGMGALEVILDIVSAPGALVPLLIFAPPTALAIVALTTSILDGLRVGGVLTAVLAVLTLSVTALSIAALVFPTGGGVFMGHLLVAVAAIPLAVVVLVRPILDHVVHEELTPRLRSRLGH